MPTARKHPEPSAATSTAPLRRFSDVSHEQLLLWASELIDASEHALIFVDELWRVQYWSPQAEQLLGWKENHVLGKGLGGVLGLTPEGNRRLREGFAERGPVLRERLPLRRAGGTKIDRTVIIRQLAPGADGAKAGCLVTIQNDIISRTTQEFHKFFHAVDQSMVGALMANAQGTIEYANPRAVEILGLSPMALIGCSLTESADGPGDGLFLLPEPLHLLADWRRDILYQHPDQQALTLYVVASGIRDGSGALVNRVLIFEDLTERRAIEQAERDLRDQMAQAGRLSALGELATSIAHEINQPLAAIANYSKGSLRRMRMSPGSVMESTADVIGALEEISRQVERASAIIQNVRRLASRKETEMSPVQLDLLVQQLMPIQSITAKKADARLDYQCRHKSPVVMGNETQLSQIILNLCKNGFDAMADTPPEQRQLSMRIEDAPDQNGQNRLNVIFEDRGCGIADEDLSRIGTPFFTRKANGLGLGLSMSRTMLEAHGCHLLVKRNPPPHPGMTFSFALPVSITPDGASS